MRKRWEMNKKGKISLAFLASAFVLAFILAITVLQISSAKDFIINEVSSPSTTYFMVNGSSGKVGIGNGVPDEVFTVGTSSTRGAIRVYQVDDATSDQIQFYNDGTRVGEIGTEDATWLRINQETAKNIYTPQYIRADGGLHVDSTSYGISGSGILLSSSLSGTYSQALTLSSASNAYTGASISIGGNSYLATSSGNVGIRTASPTELLTINGTHNTDQVQIMGPTANDDSLYQWDGSIYRNHGDHVPEVIIRSDNSNPDIGGYRPALVLYNNIGSLNNTVGLTFAMREETSAGNAVTLASIMGIKESVGAASSWSDGGLQFIVKDGGVGVHAMRIINTGNIGIGTTTPTQKLDVRGSINVSADVYVNNGTSLATWAYNQTLPAITYTNTYIGNSNASWSTTYNVTYQTTSKDVTANRSEWFSTYNASYVPSGTANAWSINAANVTAGTFGAGNFVFQNNLTVGTTQFFVNKDSGNVGIGTTASDYNLQVGADDSSSQQEIGVNSAANIAAGYIWDVAGTAKWFLNRPASSNDLRLNEVGVGDKVTFQAGGNVGIGTTSPEGKLHIIKGTTNSGVETDFAIKIEGVENGDIGLLLGTDTGINVSYIHSFDPGTGWNRNLILQERGGNVGIGTTAPNARLSLGASLNNTKLAIYDNGATSMMGFGVQADQFRIHLNGATDRFSFLDDEVGTNELVTIKGTGNVGIGTVSPTSKLTVNGTVDVLNNKIVNLSTPTLVTDAATKGYVDSITGNGANLSGSGSNTYVTYWTGTNTMSGESAFIYDAAGNRLNVTASSAVATGIYTTGYVEDVGGLTGGNYIPSHSWNIGNGTVGIFTRNGADNESVREWGLGPHGNPTILWVAYNDAASDGDGGWDSSFFATSSNKSYRFSVWIKKTGSTDGSTYLGTSGSPAAVLTLAGADNTNPYFWSGDLPELNKWYLIVGYVRAYSDTGTTNYGGIYDGMTGEKVLSITDFKSNYNTTSLRHRSYLYYDTTTTDRQYWWDPRVEEVNGREPTIEALLGATKSATNNTDAYFGGKVGIGTATPSALLDIKKAGAGAFGLNVSGNLYVNDTNVGIGTAAPATALHISPTGSAPIIRGAYVGAGSYGEIDLYGYGTGLMKIQSGSGYNLVLNPTSGNVGIGNSTPGARLEIAAPASGATLKVGRVTGNPNIKAAADNYLIMDSNGQFTALNYYVSDNVVLAYGGGNVSIGASTTPASKLDIDTGSNTLGLRLRGLAETAEIADFYVGSAGGLVISTTAGTDNGAFIDLRPEDDTYGLILRESDGTGTSTYANFYVTDAADDYLSIGVNTGSDGDALVVTAANRVGIGITAPSSKLDINASSGVALGVEGGISGVDLATFTRNGGAYSKIIIGSAGGDAYTSYQGTASRNWTTGFDASDGSYRIAQKELLGTNDKLTILTSGNVGIGTTNPSQTLTVVGTGNFSSTANPGLMVGDGSTGYLKVGSTGWYDDGTYFSPLGTRHFYVRSTVPSTYLYSDNTYLGSTSGDNILLRDNELYGNDWIINYNEAGNVGIGTTSPISAFHINSTSAAGSLYIQNSSNVHMFINSTSGVVGIGTTNFSSNTIAKFFVNGTIHGSSTLNIPNDYGRINSVLVGYNGNSALAGAVGEGGSLNLQNAVSESFAFKSFAATTANPVFVFNATPSGSTENLWQLQRAGAAKVTIDNSGNLEVNGKIRVNNTIDVAAGKDLVINATSGSGNVVIVLG